ncbi:MAG: hypothetical protein ACM358_05050 [Gemmatimonadota bacterium]
MIAADIDRIPDGEFGQYAPAKAVLRAVVALVPDAEQQLSYLVGAIMLLAKSEDRPAAILRVVADCVRHGAHMVEEKARAAQVPS